MSTGITNHFTDFQAAYRYYRVYGFDRKDVIQKVEDNEIEIGPPEIEPGQKLRINLKEQRYEIYE